MISYDIIWYHIIYIYIYIFIYILREMCVYIYILHICFIYLNAQTAATHVVLRLVPPRHWSRFWAMAMALDESHKQGWES